jgi:outer membrane lipoprotein SlyB
MLTCKIHRAIAVAAAISFAAMAPISANAGDKKVEGAAKGAAVGAAVGAVTGVGIGAAAVTGAVIGGATAKDSKDNKAEKSKSSGKPDKTKE